MGSVAHEVNSQIRPQVGHGRLLVPIIADWGKAAAVVMVGFTKSPRLGDSFRFQGRDWVITRARDHARTYVARPVRRRR